MPLPSNLLLMKTMISLSRRDHAINSPNPQGPVDQTYNCGEVKVTQSNQDPNEAGGLEVTDPCTGDYRLSGMKLDFYLQRVVYYCNHKIQVFTIRFSGFQ